MGSLLQLPGDSPYEYHHVVLSSRDKRLLFRGNRQRELFLELVHRAQRRTGIHILAYVLLDTDAHFVVQTIRDTSTRSRFVQRLKSQYARRVQKIADAQSAAAHEQHHTFKRRYRAYELTLSTVQQAIDHLHLLPVQRGLTSNQNRYEWSSRRAYLLQVKLPWLSVNWWLELDKLPDFPLPLPLSPEDAKQLVAWLVEAVMGKVGLPIAELQWRKRSRKLTLVRGVVAYHAMRLGVTLRAVANALKKKSSSTLASSTLTAAIDRYEPKYPELFDIEIHELLAEILARRTPRELFASNVEARTE